MKVGVLFVCMGNICRSPTAEGVFRKLVSDEGLAEHFTIDSAGTLDYHAGEAPDPRAQETAQARGIDIGGLIARQVVSQDIHRFDHLLAMDRENLTYMHDLFDETEHHKLALFATYAANHDLKEVPDPYYGGRNGFDHVFDLVEDASRGLLRIIRETHGF